MPLGLVAGYAGSTPRVRATQLFNAIPAADRANWRIFYFDNAGTIQEYTTSSFNNPGVNIATQTHCLIFCHGRYDSSKANRSNGLSWWDSDATTGSFDTTRYTTWLANIAVGVTTLIVAACHAGDIGTGGAGNIPIQDIVAVRPGMHADGPNTALMALGGVTVSWNAAGAPAGWTRF